jgi:hypothetical protein
VESIAKMRGRVIEAVGDIDILVRPSDYEIPCCSAQADARRGAPDTWRSGVTGEPQGSRLWSRSCV